MARPVREHEAGRHGFGICYLYSSVALQQFGLTRRRQMRAKGQAIAVLAALLCGACSSSPKATGNVVAPTVTNSSEAAKVSDEARARAIVLADTDFPSGWQ